MWVCFCPNITGSGTIEKITLRLVVGVTSQREGRYRVSFEAMSLYGRRKDFFQGGQNVVTLILPSRNQENNLFAKNSVGKFHNSAQGQCPPFRRPCLYIYLMLTFHVLFFSVQKRVY